MRPPLYQQRPGTLHMPMWHHHLKV